MAGISPSRRTLVAGLTALVAGVLPDRASARTNAYYQGPVSDHFDGTRFFNPGSKDEDHGLADVLRWQLSSRATAWPGALPATVLDHPPARLEESRCRISFVGHASFLVQVDGLNILLDPVWSERASPLGFAGPARHTPPGVAFDDLPPIDAVLVSHNHYDHMDLGTLARLWRRDRPRIIVPLGNDAIIRGADHTIAVESGDWGDTIRLNPRIVVHLHRTHHWSARGLNDRRHALWASFVIEAPHGGIYFVGDTAFGDGNTFREVARAHPRLGLALLPVGAYAPRWFMKDQHMNPAEAVEAFRLCGARQAVGHHWGTFHLTDEGYDEPPRDLATALARAGMPPQSFATLLPGSVVKLGV
jgi:L-ascorbate metabolism protein UlaG (beta-lactamase superfamily)